MSFSKLSTGAKLGVGVNIAFTAVDAFSNMRQGDGVVRSVVKAGTNFLISDTMFGLVGAPAAFGMMGAQLGVAGVSMAIEGGRESAKQGTKGLRGMTGGGFKDSQNAYTMRQRGMTAINNAGDRTMNTLGSEARTYFRNYVE